MSMSDHTSQSKPFIRWRVLRIVVGLLAVFSLVAAACGDDDDATQTQPAADEPAPAEPADEPEPAPAEPADEPEPAPAEPADEPEPAPAVVETLKIGVIESQTSFCAPVDVPALAGIEVAADQINETGFEVGGTTYNIELIIEDGQSSNEGAVVALNKLIGDDGVDIVIGPGCGAYGAPGLGAIAQQNEVILFNSSPAPLLEYPDSTEFIASGEAQFLFKGEPKSGNAAAGQAALPFAFFDKEDIDRVYILVQNDDGGNFYGGSFGAYMESQGKTVENEYYDPTTLDYSGILQRVKDFEPDLFVYGYLIDPALAILTQALELDVSPRYYGYGARIDDATERAVGGPIGIPWMGLEYPRSLLYANDPDIAALAPLVAEKLGRDIQPGDSYAMYHYHYLPILVQAMQAAGTVSDTTAIAAALEAGTFNVGGVGEAGPLVFDQHSMNFPADGCLVNIDGTVECRTFPQPPED
jgi:branched-chain amino acid transport system substrate-binding protein